MLNELINFYCFLKQTRYLKKMLPYVFTKHHKLIKNRLFESFIHPIHQNPISGHYDGILYISLKLR